MNLLLKKKALIIMLFSLFYISNLAFGQTKENLKNLTPPEGKALVYVVRPAKAGMIVSMNVFVNGTEIGKTKGSRFLYGFFKPGTYIFKSKAENEKEISLTLEAGKTYYLKQKVKMGVAKARTDLELLSIIEGKKALKKCKLSKFQTSPHFVAN